MELEGVVSAISNLSKWSHADRIKLFAWYLHTHEEREHFSASDVMRCYDTLHVAPPASIHSFLAAMVQRKPKEALKTAAGYRLEKRVRDDFEVKYGGRAATVQIDKLLSGLPARVPNIDERDYLNEALICIRHEAPRAAIVMTWNLAYNHLCQYVLAKHLPAFNAQLPRSYPKARITQIRTRDDLTELKESELIQVCASANIVSSSLQKILSEKLARRNVAAHPSNVAVRQLQAEDFIQDLVENVVLKLA